MKCESIDGKNGVAVFEDGSRIPLVDRAAIQRKVEEPSKDKDKLKPPMPVEQPVVPAPENKKPERIKKKW